MSVLKFSLIQLIVGIGLFFCGYFIVVHYNTKILMESIAKHLPIFLECRLISYLIILFIWPYLVAAIGKNRRWPNTVITYLSNQQLKLSLLFTIVEIFFFYNLIGRLFNKF